VVSISTTREMPIAFELAQAAPAPSLFSGALGIPAESLVWAMATSVEPKKQTKQIRRQASFVRGIPLSGRLKIGPGSVVHYP
jgi:hypothetical protein